MKNIFLSDVLNEMAKYDDSGEPVHFNIKVREFNEQTKMGGKAKYYANAQLMMPSYAKKKKISAIDKLKYVDVYVARKKPNHWENRTRNIKLENGEIKKIKILFIIEFNNKLVVY